jgi:ankyrin repeat protein
MDQVKTYFESFKEGVLTYRRWAYYYLGYRVHELRLPTTSASLSAKLEAVKRNDLKMIQEKVFGGDWKVDDCVSINNMTTMLHEAVVMDRFDIFSFLLRQGADPNLRDRNGMTPLLKAAALGRTRIVYSLLEYGVNPNQRDPHGCSALNKARLHEEWEVVDLLTKLDEKPVKGHTKWQWPPDI